MVYQACDTQSRWAFTQCLGWFHITLEAAGSHQHYLGYLSQGAIKPILFQIVAVCIQEKQLETQIPFFQKDFDPAGKLREGRCKWKFLELWVLLRFKFLPWDLRMGMFVKFILKMLPMNWNWDPLLTILSISRCQVPWKNLSVQQKSGKFWVRKAEPRGY